MNARRTRGNPPQPTHEPQREWEGSGPWLRIQLDPFALLFVTHRAEHKNFRYIGARGDVEALDQKLLRALATEPVGLGRKVSSRTELIDEMWQRITAGFETTTLSHSRAIPAQDSPNEPVRQTLSDSGPRPERSILASEIESLRKALNSKLAELRAIDGPGRKVGSGTVERVLTLLLGAGATKSQLVTETGAKKGYVDALLGRILPDRGYVITSDRSEGSREKMYHAELLGSQNADSERSTKRNESNERASA